MPVSVLRRTLSGHLLDMLTQALRVHPKVSQTPACYNEVKTIILFLHRRRLLPHTYIHTYTYIFICINVFSKLKGCNLLTLLYARSLRV